MDNKEWLPLDLVKTTTQYLSGKGIPTPRLDAEVLLCEVLGCSRLKLYSGFDRALSSVELSAYREYIRRRSLREPVSRILGKREFMGLDFKVTPDVLSPRPETEILVEKALQVLDPSPKKKKSAAVFEAMDKKLRQFITEQAATNREGELPGELAAMLQATQVMDAEPADSTPVEVAEQTQKRILDLGTGSGCILVSILKLNKQGRGVAVDLSREALNIAAENAMAHGVDDRLKLRQGDFFGACENGEKFDLIVSNPPYLVEGDSGIWPEVKGFDPELALYADNDGLACYQQITAQAKDWLVPGGWLLLEVGAGQAGAVEKMILDNSPLAEVSTLPDHSGIERVVCACNL